MLKQYVSSPSSAGSDADMAAFALPRSEPLPRAVADIKAPTAALPRPEPALESWTKAPANTGGKPRPVWLLIGVLWLSTALVTAGAVVALASLAGSKFY